MTNNTQLTLCKPNAVEPFTLNKSFRLAALFAVLSVLFSTRLILPSANAQTPISMQPFSQDLEYGIIANENGICRMNDRGSLIGLSGQSCLGSGTRGIFNIIGEPGRVIYITANGSGNNGVGFTPKISGSANKVIAANGSTLLVVAGDLELNNATGGKHSLDYVICVHYE